MRATEPSEPFLTISGLAPTHEAAAALIGSAREVLNISCWEADLDALREPLVAADARSVRALRMLYGEQDPREAGCAIRTRTSWPAASSS